MQDSLDNQNVISQKDPFDALGAAANEWSQLTADLQLQGDVAPREFKNIVIAGMGGSALAGDLLHDWLNFQVPFEVVKGYDLPAYVGNDSLVIVSSFSGNTEETLSMAEQAIDKGATVAAAAGGGKLEQWSKDKQIPFVAMPLAPHVPQRMGVFLNANAFLVLLESFGVVSGKRAELATLADWLKSEAERWVSTVPSEYNLAKQLAINAAGKTPVIYAANTLKNVAYKWKISFNENSKTVAFWNVLPEFSHNEFIGWTSHPVEKAFAVFDLRSDFEHERISKRFELTDKLLSGKRPKAYVVELEGNTAIGQMLWGYVLADFVSIYLAILNGVEPTKVELIEKLKAELS